MAEFEQSQNDDSGFADWTGIPESYRKEAWNQVAAMSNPKLGALYLLGILNINRIAESIARADMSNDGLTPTPDRTQHTS